MPISPSIINWFGGKYRLLRYILPFPKHRLYVEPFSGSGVVLINKIPSESEIYNDINSRLVNMWRVVQKERWRLMKQTKLSTLIRNTNFMREHEPIDLMTFKEFCKCFGDLNARDLFYEFINDPSKDEIENAFQFFWINRHSYSGNNKDFGGIRMGGKTLHHLQHEWVNKLEEIERLSKRMTCVTVENQDYKHLLKRFDQPEVLIYADPPYFVGGKNYEKMAGGVGWSNEDFGILRDILWEMEHPKIIISIDDPDYYTKVGWFVQPVERTNTADPVKGRKRTKVIEYIIRNFDNERTEKMKTEKMNNVGSVLKL